MLKPGAKVVLRKRKPLRPRIIIQADSDGEEGVTLNETNSSVPRDAYDSDIENEGKPRYKSPQGLISFSILRIFSLHAFINTVWENVLCSC